MINGQTFFFEIYLREGCIKTTDRHRAVMVASVTVALSNVTELRRLTAKIFYWKIYKGRLHQDEKLGDD